MWWITKTFTWIPLELLLLYVLWKHVHDWRKMLLAVLGVTLVVMVADQFASGVCKGLFCRWRPSHEPALEGLVHIVNGYRGGSYGFISSHAANTFGVATYLSLMLRRRWVLWVTFMWAFMCSYSRIYLGVHYPGDILCGALWGIFVAYIIYHLYLKIASKYLDA